jgi:hypothetical protein
MIRRGVPACVLAVIGGGVAVAVAPDAHAAGAVLKATFSQTSAR